ncbi:MAG TPA: UDP-N-acetyl glucosamine 2-epimerase [Gemmatimonadales bacterium]|nr:UDP-N-acetyl glucosamine 2-epimerase [Gemmatimonadales bacterium]
MDRPATALCYGTRPQVIKASVVRRELARLGGVLAVDTGQHYDYELNALLYAQLGVLPADVLLDVGSAGHAEQTAAILVRAERVLAERRPRAVVVIGDTNSTVGCALAAAKLRIPVVHVEAGLRAADALMAEEINRRVVDAIAQVLCTPSARATGRVRAERCDAAIHQTGDVARDVLLASEGRLPDLASVAPAAAASPFCYATLHRAELTERPDLLLAVLDALAALDRPVILPLHPRTRAVLDARAADRRWDGRLTLLPPLGYLESLALIRGADLVVTDSGGVQREAYWLGVPCVTLRAETEWVETVELGANLTVDPVAADRELPAAVEQHRTRWRAAADWDRDAYGTGDAAARVAAAVAPLIAA